MLAAVILLLATVALPLAAQAQNKPVFQSGLVKNGHASVWMSNGVIGDAGPADAGNLTELGITNTGTPFCVNDTLTTSPTGYHQFCIGALALGGGLLNYGNYGASSPLPFTVNATGALIFNSQTQVIEAKNLPPTSGDATVLCISPTTGNLSVSGQGGCGGPPIVISDLLLNGGGYVLLNGGAGKIRLN